MAGIDNLKPWEPGQSGNPAGKPPGTRSWATIVQGLLDDPDLAESLLEEKPGWWDKLPNKNAHEAIATAMTIRALGGDVKAATWLRKTAYGDKLDLTTDGQPVKAVALFDMRAGTKMQLVPVKATKTVSKKVAQPKKARKSPAKKPAK